MSVQTVRNVAAVVALVAFVLGVAATMASIWTSAPLSERLGETGLALVFAIAAPAGIVGATAWVAEGQ